MKLIAMQRHAAALRHEARQAGAYANSLPAETVAQMDVKIEAHRHAAKLYGQASEVYGQVSDGYLKLALVLWSIAALLMLLGALL